MKLKYMNWKIKLGLLAVIFLCLNSFFRWLPQDIFLEMQRKTTLVPVNTLTGTHERNSALISILQESISNDISSSNNRANTITQFRLFYVAILSALVVLVFAANTASNQLKIYLLFFIVCMYALEVHLNDLNYRLDNLRKTRHRDIELLINKSPSDTIWYNVCPSDSIWSGFKDAELSNGLSHRPKLWLRKLIRFWQPEIDQVVVYVLPWMFLLIFEPRIRKKYRLTSNSS